MREQEFTTASRAAGSVLRCAICLPSGSGTSGRSCCVSAGFSPAASWRCFWCPPTYESKSSDPGQARTRRSGGERGEEQSAADEGRRHRGRDQLGSRTDYQRRRAAQGGGRFRPGRTRNRRCHSSFYGQSQDAKISKAIEKLRSHLVVEPIKKTNVIQLTYSAHEPKSLRWC